MTTATAAERSYPQIRELDLKGLLARLFAGLRRVFANDKSPELQPVCAAKVSQVGEGYRSDQISKDLPMIDDLIRNVGAVVFRKKEVAMKVAKKAEVPLFSFEINSGTFFVLGRKQDISLVLGFLEKKYVGQHNVLLNMKADKTLLRYNEQLVYWARSSYFQVSEDKTITLREWLELAR